MSDERFADLPVLGCGDRRPAWGTCSGCGRTICGACWHHNYGKLVVCRACYNRGWDG